ncbi:MAG: TonB-dependent receptor [Bacteroidetes bacterium]|nr:TonB-dependent receptor [Bacteroidota bacterium]
MLAKLISFFLMLLFSLNLSAQIDSSIQLRTVQINSIRNENNSTGLKQEKTDSLIKMISIDKSMGTVLSEQSPALVKNYGPGALSSVSMRGGSAYHTAVLWKGFSLANPMNGVMDFNLLPTFLFEDISIQYGGATAIWGSGAVSGVIHLNDNNTFINRNSLKVGSRYSNASGWANFIDGKFSIKNFSSSIKLFLTDEKNAYPFQQDDEMKKQVHAESKGSGLIAENTYSINTTTAINFNFWYQYANRNIAPVMTEAISNAVQRDRNYRYNITFTKDGNKGRFAFRNAYFNESLYYNDSALSQPSNSLCKTFISEPEYSYAFNEHHSIQTGINFTKINAITAEYNQEEEVIRESIYLSYRFQFRKLILSASARKEFNNYEKPPFAFSLGANYKMNSWIKLLANYSTVYRNPQVNDLYWQPGGNIDLLPETGYTYEGTINLDLLHFARKIHNDTNAISIQLTAFNKNIDNWIAWTPHGILWTPGNIKSVHSYGSESVFIFRKQFAKTGIRLSAFYGYTVSETTSSEIPYDASVGKQLIYVPFHKAGGTFSVYYRKSIVSVNHTFTGVRFINTDNSDFLESYGLSNVQIDQRFDMKNNSIAAFFRIDNLFNTDYQSVQNRPQPLRTYSIGINLTFRQ